MLPQKNNYIILGDFNAKIGRDCHKIWPLVSGKFSIGERNAQGDRLLQFSAINNLTIVNTLYKHKTPRLVTWISPDLKTRNQIDFIITQKENLKLFRNCRVYNSADIGSDHSLLMAKISLVAKIRKINRRPLKRFNVDKLLDRELSDYFEQKIGGRFEPLIDLDEDIDTLYNNFKDITNELTREVVGLRRRKAVEGLTKEEADLCHQRREARKRMLADTSIRNKENYRQLNIDVKKSIRNAKARNLKEKIDLLEDQFRKNDSHNLFKTVKELEGKPRKSLSVIKDSNGNKVFQFDSVLTLWKEHFEKHLNTSFPHDENALSDLDVNDNEQEIPQEEITKDEIRKSVRKMKNRKAPGFDAITSEVIKAGGEAMVNILHKIFNLALRSGKTPQDFSRMIVSPVYKKGDKLARENYRAISLLSIPGKIFLRIIMGKMELKIDERLKESQYGFRPGRGTTDAIFIARQIIEKANERKIPLHFHFIDFKSAFDTVWRKALWKMLKKIGVDPRTVNLIEYMYKNTQCAVVIDGTITDWFAVEVGVRQGCILSPVLFNIFLEFVMDEVNSLQELHLNNNMVSDIRYADDTTLVSVIFDKLKISTDELEKACSKWGLKINASKCKTLTPELNDDVFINGEVVEKMESFVFLGSCIPGTTEDVKRRIALASSAFGRLKKNVWARRDLSLKIKVRLYNSLILPIAIYASETWTLKSEDTHRLLVFENDCLRAMLGKTRLDRCKMDHVRERLGVKKKISDIIQLRRLTWFGHVIRKGEDSYVKRAYKEQFSGARPRGRPPKRWVDQIREDFKLPILTIERKTQDRQRWKQLVKDKCAKTL